MLSFTANYLDEFRPELQARGFQDAGVTAIISGP